MTELKYMRPYLFAQQMLQFKINPCLLFEQETQ